MEIKQTEFNLTPLFNGDNDPRMMEERAKTEALSRAFINKWKDRSDYLENVAASKEALDEYEFWQRTCGADGDEGYYFWMRSNQDKVDPAIKANVNKITEFSDRIANEIMFFELRLGKIDIERQDEFLSAEELKKYHAFLTRIFKKAKYKLSEAEERIMNLKNDPAFNNWHKMVSGLLSREEREILQEDGSRALKSFSAITELTKSQNKAVRDEATDAASEIFLKYIDVAENELNSILQDKKINDELRGYTRPDESRHVRDNIETEVVDALVSTVSARFDIPARFYELKAKLFGMEKLDYNDRNVQYGQIDKSFSYADSIDLVHEVLGELDPQFAQILKKFVDEGAIDVYPRKGKCSGAFCAHYLITQPTYILLNHADKLSDVLTLAHEVGHGINNELTKEKQNALDFGTSTATAEVASTFMEDFLLERILRDADEELRLVIMMKKLDDLVATIFRQVALYKFEQELHRDFREKGYLSKDEIGKLFVKHMSSYMGEAVLQNQDAENRWIPWSHIRYFFYVYSYASGLLISKSLQSSVKSNPEFINEVKKFLSSGLSASPKQVFADLEIDITDAGFWQKGLDEIEALLNETTTLARKLGKI